MGHFYSGFKPYVPVARRRLLAQKQVEKLQKEGKEICPVHIDGRTIAKTFWGKAWIDHLESYRDYENRLPRGRTYTRNGSVVHLEINEGSIEALVSESSIYKISIQIAPLDSVKWERIVQGCFGQINSPVELLRGEFSPDVIEILTNQKEGLFPSPDDIKMKCSCPEYTVLCKHVAAVMYGVGARLDKRPEDLFLLRSVNLCELLVNSEGITGLSLDNSALSQGLSALLGIDIEISDKRKNHKQSNQSMEKNSNEPRRKRGRPRKINATEVVSEPKKRGRPRKITPPNSALPLVAKKRGRPRKNNIVSSDMAPIAKKRGRPRKDISSLTTPLSIVKKRGRPRKEKILTPTASLASQKTGTN